jgi:hypothetical protein
MKTHKSAEDITRKALALIEHFNWKWLAKEIIGIGRVSKAAELTRTHAWTIDQSTAINSRYERIFETQNT